MTLPPNWPHPGILGAGMEQPQEIRDELGCGMALLVGEAPNAATVGRPFHWLLPDSSGIPHTANRIASFAGLGIGEYRRLFDRANLLLEAPPERWPAGIAWARAEELLEHERDRPLARHVVLLGRRVADAFGIRGQRWPGWYEWTDLHRVLEWHRLPSLAPALAPSDAGWIFSRVAVVPHPSRRSRLWNGPTEEERSRAFWVELVRVLRDRCDERTASVAERIRRRGTNGPAGSC